MAVLNPIFLKTRVPDFDSTVNGDDMKMALTVMLEYCRRNLTIPGQLENWVLVMNTSGVSITDIDRKMMKDVFGYLALMFKCTTRRTYILNSSAAVSFLWNFT